MDGMAAGREDSDAEAVVRGTFRSLDGWRAAPGPFRPGPGSELMEDDYDWRPFGVSQVAWTGLSAALDHLQAVRSHVDAATPSHFPQAHLTLCRTALVGASVAVWVLAPDVRADRIARARQYVAYMQQEHLNYLGELQRLGPHEGTDLVAEHLKERQAELAVKRAADGQAGALNTTRIIRTAARHAFVEERYVVEAVAMWRSGSGSAHALPYPLLGRRETVQQGAADSDGLATLVAAGSFDTFANAYMLAFHLTKHGWRLIRRRGR